MAPKELRLSLRNSLHPIDEEPTNGTDHSYSLADYVIVNQCDSPCIDCEYMNITDLQALQICLNEEKLQNRKYRTKLNSFMRKYQQLIRQLKYQQTKIEQLSKLLAEQMAYNGTNLHASQYDYTVIESELHEETRNNKMFNQVKLEFI